MGPIQYGRFAKVLIPLEEQVSKQLLRQREMQRRNYRGYKRLKDFSKILLLLLMHVVDITSLSRFFRK
jgi:hypothetical protein